MMIALASRLTSTVSRARALSTFCTAVDLKVLQFLDDSKKRTWECWTDTQSQRNSLWIDSLPAPFGFRYEFLVWIALIIKWMLTNAFILAIMTKCFVTKFHSSNNDGNDSNSFRWFSGTIWAETTKLRLKKTSASDRFKCQRFTTIFLKFRNFS